MKKTILSLAALTLFFGACKKNDPVAPVTLTPKESLLGAWVKTSQKTTTTIGSTAPTVVDNLPNTCVRNYLYRYVADGTLTAEESDNAAERCDPNGPKVLRTASWMLLDGDKQLVTFGSSYQTIDTLFIAQLSSTAMRLTKTITGTLGTDSIKRVFEYSYTKK